MNVRATCLHIGIDLSYTLISQHSYSVYTRYQRFWQLVDSDQEVLELLPHELMSTILDHALKEYMRGTPSYGNVHLLAASVFLLAVCLTMTKIRRLT